jgi:WD40 repeat protein
MTFRHNLNRLAPFFAAKAIVLSGLLLALLNSCAPPAGNEMAGLGMATAVTPPAPLIAETMTLETMPTTAVVLTQDTPAPSSAEFPILTPPPPTADPIWPQPLLGGARRVGRGQLLDAAFLPGGGSFVIALGWTNGISLATLEGQELWWQPTDARLVALAADRRGERIASMLQSGAVLVYAADRGDVRRTAESAPDVDQSDLAFSPDGRRLAFQSIGPNRGDPIFLLDLDSGAVSDDPRSRIHPGVRPYLIWSPDGQTLTLPTLGEDCTHIFNLNTGEKERVLQNEAGCYLPWSVAYAPDGAQIAIAYFDGVVDLLQPDSGQVTAQLAGDVLIRPDQTVSSLLFSPDGHWLATPGGYFWGKTYSARVWEVGTEDIVAETSASGSHLAIAFTDDALLSVYNDGRITRWLFTEAGAGEEVVGQIPVIAPHFDFRWSADGTRLAAPLTFGGAAVWDVGQDEAIALFPAPLAQPALSPDGRRLALFHPGEREIQLYAVDNGMRLASFADADSLPAGDPFSPDGRWLAYTTGNRLQLARVDGEETAVLLEGHREDQGINRVLWSPASDALVVASLNPSATSGQIILWEQAEDGVFVAAYQGESVRTGYANIAAFSPQGRYVAFEILLDDEVGLAVEVYDRQGGTAVLRAEKYELLTWLSDELLLTHGQPDRQFTQWEVETGRPTTSTKGPIGSEVFAPTGGFYAYPANAGPDTGRAIKLDHWQGDGAPQEYHVGSSIRKIHWSPNGRWLVILAGDSSLWLWPVALPESER